MSAAGNKKQESILIEYVPPASVAITRCQYWGGGGWQVYQGVVYQRLGGGYTAGGGDRYILGGRYTRGGVWVYTPPPEGTWDQAYIPTPTPVVRHTPVKTLPSRNFVVGR